MKVAIIPGFAEGRRIGKRLRTSLKKHGLTNSSRIKSADVIIAHSGGAFVVPVESQAKLIVLIGLPFWPGKHPIRNLPKKIRHEPKTVYFFKKSIYNLYEVLKRPTTWLQMHREWQKSAIPALPKGAQVVLVRNTDDRFVHADAYQDLARQMKWQIVELPGHHDDLWSNPQPYAQIVLTYSQTDTIKS